jgi:photosystem II stability/assembly factor-like uncharacterized protein
MKSPIRSAAALLLLACAASASQLWALPPAAEVQVIAACDKEHYRHSEGSAIQLDDGRILLTWSKFDGDKDRCGTLGDNGPATIVMAESTDGGKTWSKDRKLPVGTATRNIMQSAFVPVKGRLMLAFSVRMREGHTSIKFAIDSSDGGRTWTERRKLFDAGGANDRAVRLSTGRILMPSHRRTSKLIGKDKDAEVLVARSDDEGRTWQMTEPIPHIAHEMETRVEAPRSIIVHEPTIAECPDRSLLMIARSTVGVFYESRSIDAGETWSQFTPTTIKTFAAPPYMRRLQDGRLALLWNPLAGKNGIAAAEKAAAAVQPFPLGRRERLALMTSDDGGKTWSEPRTVVEDGRYGYCYPCVLEQKDGSLMIFCARTPYTIYPCDFVQLAPFRP